jgi:hypothetical protein
MAILVTNAVQVARFANALYGIKLGSVTNAAVNADIASIGLTSSVNAYYNYSFGSMTTAAVASVILGNLGLSGNAAAQAYVEGQLNAAGSAKGAAVLTMLNEFSNMTSDATFGAAATAWNSKIVEAQAYTASNAVDVATSAATAGQTFTLTTSTDTFNGGAGDDTVSSNHLTWANDDILNGGAGTDTLTLLNTGATVSRAPAILTGFENIQVTSSTGATSSAINLVAATDVAKVVSKNSVVADSFTNIQTNAAVEIDGKSGATTDGYVTASFKDTLTTTTTTGNVTLKGGSAVTALQIGGAGGADGKEFGTLAITSSGSSANSLTLVTQADGGSLSVDALAVTIAGSADLTLGTSSAAFAAAGASIDASAATGALTVNGTNFETITLGSGNDTLYVASTQISGTTVPQTLNGGGGSNTLDFGAQDLSASGLANSTAADDVISNFQTISFTAALANGGTTDLARSIDATAAGISGVTTIIVNAENNDASAGGGSGEDVTVAVSGLNASQKVQLSFKASSTNTNDEIVTLAMASPTGSTDSVTLESVAGTNTAVNSISTLTVSQTTVDSVAQSVETLNVIASRADVSSAVGTTISAVDAGYTAALTVSGASNITIAAAELLDSSTADTTYATIDASALTGNLILGGSGADFQSTDADDIQVTLGSGTNAVYGLAALDDGDTITGTTGTDSVYITGGSGAVNLVNIDTVQYTSGSATTTSAANWTATTIDVTNSTLSSTISNIKAGQAIKVDDIDSGETLTLNVASGVTALAIELDTATASAGTLATNATSLTINHSGVDGSGDYANNALALNVTPTSVTLAGGGETSSAGVHSAFVLTNHSSGLIETVNSTYNGNVTVSGVYFNTVNGATVTTGANTVASTLTVAAASLANGVVRYIDTSGTDTLSSQTDYKGGALGIVNVQGFETISFNIDADTSDSGVDFSMNMRDSTGYTTLQFVEGETDGFEEDISLSNVASGTTVRIAGSYGDGADTVTITAATGSSDSLTLTSTTATAFSSANTSAAVTSSGFETVSIVGGGVTGTAIAVDLRTQAITTTLTGATTLNLGSASATQVGAVSLATLAATSLTTVNVNTTGGAVTVTTLGTVSSLENLTITTATSNAATIAGGTAATLDLITASGAGNVTISALSASSLDSIDASGVTGVVTLGSSSAALTVASGAAFTTGEGNDVINLGVGNLHAVNAGEKASDNDSLVIIGSMNSGAIVVDLSASGDQVATFNGSANAAVQTGFESINLTAVTSTGSYGATVTANAAGSSISGTAYNDTVYLAAGVDTITFAAAGSNGTDTVNNFNATGLDVLNVAALITGTLTADLDGTTTTDNGDLDADTIVSTGRADAVDDTISLLYNELGTLAASDVAVSAANGKVVLADNAEAVVIVAAASTSTAFNVYKIIDSDAAGTQTYSVTLIGTVNLESGQTVADLTISNFGLA